MAFVGGLIVYGAPRVVVGLRLDEEEEYVGADLSILPLTHFLHLVRGIMLKGNGFVALWPNIWPILVFMLVVIGLGLGVYRKTLD